MSNKFYCIVLAVMSMTICANKGTFSIESFNKEQHEQALLELCAAEAVKNGDDLLSEWPDVIECDYFRIPSKTVVAVLDTKPVGFMMYCDDPCEAVILLIYIAPKYRRMGYGTQLFTYGRTVLQLDMPRDAEALAADVERAFITHCLSISKN